MKAIQVRFLGPTNARPARLKAFAEGVKSITESRDCRLNASAQARRVAVKLVGMYGWDRGCRLVGGSLPNGDWVFVLEAE